MDQDFIRGKGRGLVMLLHGAPGTGKAATAEALALWHRKPLFVIMCSDLGFTPQGVESSLNEIFRLAHLWDCILLLDEADVFLRETNALQRNALVSVFLRVLEYYNGILFLTTNRVGTLDEAFKSRVHLSLYYPALGRLQIEQIMRMNLERLNMIEKRKAGSTSRSQLFIRKDQIFKFSVDHWDRHADNDGEGRWNDLQIRNAVQIAASLALYDRKMDRDKGAEGIPPG
ncbi:P-loop containing nucleoside triphosphate hydrolase protein [Xylaria flabelliformis]|nr:P-loop containing nucleoside triphosphate hydrolase protein [Xylaria flabelliformis]